jgi:hypothetical protein
VRVREHSRLFFPLSPSGKHPATVPLPPLAYLHSHNVLV